MPNPTPADQSPSALAPPRTGAIAAAVLAAALGVVGLIGGASVLSTAAAASPTSIGAVSSGAAASGDAGASSAGPGSPASASPGAPASVSPAPPASASPAPSRSPTTSAGPSGSPGPAASGLPGASGWPAASGSPGAGASSSPGAIASVSPSPTIPVAQLAKRLAALREKYHLPGVSVAILWDDGRQWLGTAGYRDVAAKDPMTTGTAFALASISKTLTAAVVLQLVEEGKLSLDSSVVKLLPDYPVDRRITVRMLLDHTSGLPDFFLNAKIDGPLRRAPGASWTAKQAWAYVPAKRGRPGKAWSYSNSNYLLLGVLVERTTGRPLATEIRSRILDKLSLESAWYQGVETPRAAGTRSYRVVVSGGRTRYVAVAAKSAVMPFRSVVTAAGGAGSIAATALDAARWMRAFAGGEMLDAEMQQTMLGDVLRTANLKPRIPYGLGIQALPIAGHRALGHSGRFLGFRNVVRYLPDDGITIAVLTNQGVADPAKVAESMLKIVLPSSPKPSPSASAAP